MAREVLVVGCSNLSTEGSPFSMDDTQNSDPDNSSRAGLSSEEYRAKLLTKLHCLIAVLQVALAKISKSLDLPGADERRLFKIRTNLENTMAICHRAKKTLEKNLSRLSASETPPARTPPAVVADRMSYRDYVELSSIDEYRKFKSLPPISSGELDALDLDELVRKLAES